MKQNFISNNFYNKSNKKYIEQSNSRNNNQPKINSKKPQAIDTTRHKGQRSQLEEHENHQKHQNTQANTNFN